jgi:hypothetical protein
MTKASGAILVVVVAAVVLVGGGVALAATRKRDEFVGLPPPPPPSLADDLRLIGSELVRYGGKAVAAGGKAAAAAAGRLTSRQINRETVVAAASNVAVGGVLVPYKVARGLFAPARNSMTPAQTAQLLRDRAQGRLAPVPAQAGPRPPIGTFQAPRRPPVRGLG